MNTDNIEQIIGQSPRLQEVLRAAELVAVTDVSVLITGETGTGKDMLAGHIHRSSRRHGRPFITVNCAALPESLAESLLFGHRKGAFTDASCPRQGFIAEADGGTLLLDEIGEMPLAVQAKLLRFLESGEYHPLGTAESRQASVRLIAATNIHLPEAVAAGTFRRDLYYRLNVVPLEMPPLRERGRDLQLLIESFNHQLGKYYALCPPDYNAAALTCLQNYTWPGNIRELRNFIERMLILFSGRPVDVGNLPVEFRQAAVDSVFKLPAHGLNLENLEIGLINQALTASGGNKSRAAQLLGLTRDTLLYRLKKYAI